MLAVEIRFVGCILRPLQCLSLPERLHWLVSLAYGLAVAASLIQGLKLSLCLVAGRVFAEGFAAPAA